jgi:hypothetical protein
MGFVENFVADREMVGKSGAREFLCGAPNPIGETCVRSQNSTVGIGDQESGKRIIEEVLEALLGKRG